MKKIIIVLCLVLTMSVHAQSHIAGVKISSPQLDGWTLGHMAKGALVYGAGRAIGLNKTQSVLLSAFMAFNYELFHDGLGIGYRSDPSGADFVGDLAADCLGAIIVCGIEVLLRIDKRIDLYAYGGRFGLAISL